MKQGLLNKGKGAETETDLSRYPCTQCRVRGGQGAGARAVQWGPASSERGAQGTFQVSVSLQGLVWLSQVVPAEGELLGLDPLVVPTLHPPPVLCRVLREPQLRGAVVCRELTPIVPTLHTPTAVCRAPVAGGTPRRVFPRPRSLGCTTRRPC